MGDMLELARRAVACKHWRWTPGMLVLNGPRVLTVDERDMTGLVPDLGDPATLGCVLALVRESNGFGCLREWAEQYGRTLVGMLEAAADH